MHHPTNHGLCYTSCGALAEIINMSTGDQTPMPKTDFNDAETKPLN